MNYIHNAKFILIVTSFIAQQSFCGDGNYISASVLEFSIWQAAQKSSEALQGQVSRHVGNNVIMSGTQQRVEGLDSVRSIWGSHDRPDEAIYCVAYNSSGSQGAWYIATNIKGARKGLIIPPSVSVPNDTPLLTKKHGIVAVAGLAALWAAHRYVVPYARKNWVPYLQERWSRFKDAWKHLNWDGSVSKPK